MSEILVLTRPPTDSGRLYPRYDEESGILAIESRVERPWPFGVDVDGALVFDLDERRVLANIDVHVPRSRWEKDLEEKLLMVAPAADIEFAPETIAHKSFHLPLRLSSDKQGRRLRVELGTAKPTRAVSLSASCIVLLADGVLAGFFIDEVR